MDALEESEMNGLVDFIIGAIGVGATLKAKLKYLEECIGTYLKNSTHKKKMSINFAKTVVAAHFGELGVIKTAKIIYNSQWVTGVIKKQKKVQKKGQQRIVD